MALFSVCSVYGVALRVAFMGHWGGTLVAFTVLVVILLGIGVGRLWRFSAFVASIRHAGWSVYFIYLFIYLFIFFVAWRCVQRLWGIGVGRLWRSQRL